MGEDRPKEGEAVCPGGPDEPSLHLSLPLFTSLTTSSFPLSHLCSLLTHKEVGREEGRLRGEVVLKGQEGMGKQWEDKLALELLHSQLRYCW